jgi:ABC-type transporter Mla subunit MlaD
MVSPAVRTVVSFGPVTQETPANGADTLDTAGHTILGLLHRAAGMAEENSRHALEVAQRLSQQLHDAKGLIRRLEADVKYYQERAERADQWMAQIPSEIQQRLLAAPTGPSSRRY